MVSAILASGGMPPAADPARLGGALLGLAVLAVGLVIFLLVLVVLTRAHRLRRRHRPGGADPALADPWREAGQRAQPYDKEG
jgi:hypothetical protein